MDRHVRARLATAALLVAVFGSGLVLGLALGRAGDASAEPVASSAEAEEGGERERRRPIYERVGPTEDQRVRIDSIVHVHRVAMKALQKEFRERYDPRYDALVQSTRTAIRAVFTPAQAALYDSLLAARDRHRRDERSGRDGRN